METRLQTLLDHQLWIRLARQAPFQHVTATWAAARHHAAAKNVAQAAGFGQEAFRILDWMEADSELAPQVHAHQRRIRAGAHRLNARYLLDGSFPAPALRAYAHALWLSPGFARNRGALAILFPLPCSKSARIARTCRLAFRS